MCAWGNLHLEPWSQACAYSHDRRLSGDPNSTPRCVPRCQRFPDERLTSKWRLSCACLVPFASGLATAHSANQFWTMVLRLYVDRYHTMGLSPPEAFERSLANNYSSCLGHIMWTSQTRHVMPTTSKSSSLTQLMCLGAILRLRLRASSRSPLPAECL